MTTSSEYAIDNSARIAKLKQSMKLAFLGPIIGAFIMAIMFIIATLNDMTALMMISGALLAVMMVIGVTLRRQIQQQINKLEAEQPGSAK